jgi:mannosyl-3-phosphoglycerate phosphatase
VPAPSQQDRLLIVTDLDGTLLDHATYGFSAARPALDALNARSVPLVIATSKTRLEVEEIAAAIGGNPILILENGSAVVLPAVHAFHADAEGRKSEDLVVALGIERHWLIGLLAEIATETGARVRGFHELSITEVASLTGLSPHGARLARERQFDEPFLLEREDQLQAVAAAARKRGLSVTRGGRFHHLTGPTTKGSALDMILGRFARTGFRYRTVGLGDAPNDLSFLRIVDRPIVMPRPDGDLDPELAAALPHGERAPAAGPTGWNLALMAVLDGRRLAPVGGVVV